MNKQIKAIKIELASAISDLAKLHNSIKSTTDVQAETFNSLKRDLSNISNSLNKIEHDYKGSAIHMNESDANQKYGNIAYSSDGNKRFAHLRGELLSHPSDDTICKIAEELYDVGLSDGESCAYNNLHS